VNFPLFKFIFKKEKILKAMKNKLCFLTSLALIISFSFSGAIAKDSIKTKKQEKKELVNKVVKKKEKNKEGTEKESSKNKRK
jgi:hypothetical protein